MRVINVLSRSTIRDRRLQNVEVKTSAQYIRRIVAYIV